jgi:hypothetical protein
MLDSQLSCRADRAEAAGWQRLFAKISRET